MLAGRVQWGAGRTLIRAVLEKQATASTAHDGPDEEGIEFSHEDDGSIVPKNLDTGGTSVSNAKAAALRMLAEAIELHDRGGEPLAEDGISTGTSPVDRRPVRRGGPLCAVSLDRRAAVTDSHAVPVGSARPDVPDCECLVATPAGALAPSDGETSFPPESPVARMTRAPSPLRRSRLAVAPTPPSDRLTGSLSRPSSRRDAA